ncbi:hypothetical protein L2129_01895 [Corynebacterium diphtheriae bv. mitis]|nr:hypothetical protein [Corynebacterium diphtheriae]MCM0016351.1 hypothetical protein [Corynebacterium diphtheriae bv. mitis]MCM0026059.1 hypothetical protein [Corynebacterium diphtheriae bv. mitis]MCM0029434.1 hypothetical protein [Corynebacterium diphtheriae bv. mitis]MCM0037185.1 hypothetical protein [Corynebacterium diphtheriae bv. mitis]MCM0039337.1 hypothetical protein [Corynebacterium diphtheriae bv. mitis]
MASAIYMSGIATGTANLSRFWNFRTRAFRKLHS